MKKFYRFLFFISSPNLWNKKNQLDDLRNEDIEKWLYKYMGLAKFDDRGKA